MAIQANNIVRIFSGFLFAALSSLVIGQGFPNRPIRVIVPVGPGATLDVVARIMAPEMAKALDQTITVENRPGAEQLLGIEYVAMQMPADGHTLISVQPSSLAALVVLEKNLKFNPLKDLTQFISVAESALYFSSSVDVPWRNLNEMVAFVKANPGKTNYASPSAITRFRMEMLFQNYGLNVVHIPYKGGAEFQRAVATNEVQFGLLSYASVSTFVDKIRIMASTNRQRIAALPSVPTFTELGFPQFIGYGYSLAVRAGTSQAIVDRLYGVSAAVLKQPEVIDRAAKIGLEVLALPPGAAQKSLNEEARIYAELARKLGLEQK